MAVDGSVRTDLNVDGMTCAACANRIQRRLGKVDGVEVAQVNFATGRATVTHATSVAEAALAAEIEALGYGVIDDGEDDEAEQAREADLRRRLIVGVVLAVPAMVLSMFMSLQFDGWEWVVAALATPVILWSGWPFHRHRQLLF